MNAADAKVMERLYVCLSRMTGLRPPNPANIQAISTNLVTSTEASRCLLRAVSYLGYKEHDQAHGELDQAERLLWPERRTSTGN